MGKTRHHFTVLWGHIYSFRHWHLLFLRTQLDWNSHLFIHLCIYVNLAQKNLGGSCALKPNELMKPSSGTRRGWGGSQLSVCRGCKNLGRAGGGFCTVHASTYWWFQKLQFCWVFKSHRTVVGSHRVKIQDGPSYLWFNMFVPYLSFSERLLVENQALWAENSLRKTT